MDIPQLLDPYVEKDLPPLFSYLQVMVWFLPQE